MKRIKTYGIVILTLCLNLLKINAQPIPVELMMGNKFGAVDLSFSKNFSQESRL